VRVLPYGPGAWLIEATSTRDVAPLLDALRADGIADIAELVPGAGTVLVRSHHRSLAVAAAVDAQRLQAIVEQATTTPDTPDDIDDIDDIDDKAVVEIGVRYDGNDLAEVAATIGLTVAEVIAIHSAAIYRGAFCGFAPGFCYLTGLPDQLRMARLATPRPRVPAGAVAIADDWCAVYPTASPGGWRLLGTTDARIWDVRRQPPNLLGHSTYVRFVPTTTRAVAVDQTSRRDAMPTAVELAAIEIIAPGPLATIQDGGRAGWAHLGVTRAGPMDAGAARRANRLVGNNEHAALIEVTFGGLVVRAISDVVVAISGAPCPAAVTALTPDGVQSRLGIETPFGLAAGSTLRLGAPRVGMRTYVAVRGGIIGGDMPNNDNDNDSDNDNDNDANVETDTDTDRDRDIDSDDARDRVTIEPVLGSLACDVLGGVGPPELRAGARLVLGDGDVAPITVDVAPVAELPASHEPIVVAIVAGPRLDWCEHAFDALTSTRWTVRPESNRVGIRLTGEPLKRRVIAELRSEPLIAGAIQIPPDGQPIVFGPDHPTTGGYPVVALVVDGGLDRLAQARPGQAVRFRLVP